MMIKENPPKEALRILNTREKKELNEKIFNQWGSTLEKEFVFLMNNKNKLYIADKGIGRIGFDSLRIDSIGLYVATVADKDVRLSIEGAQIIGPCANKNVLELDQTEMRSWFRGSDIKRDVGVCNGFVILKHNDDFIGCGKAVENAVLNFMPKTRRVLSQD